LGARSTSLHRGGDDGGNRAADLRSSQNGPENTEDR
jgi:hypothetical protein